MLIYSQISQSNLLCLFAGGYLNRLSMLDRFVGLDEAHLNSFCRVSIQERVGGRNSSVGSAWARCPQSRGFDPPLGTFSVEGIFPLELTWVQTPFPPKLLRMRV